jgi:putative hemolysin
MINYANQCENITGLYNGAGHTLRSKLLSCSKKFISHVLGLEKLNNIYARIADSGDGRDFLRTVLQELHISYKLDRGDLSHIPATGPVIVVANHPFGAVEGIVLAALLTEVRPDVKILANHLLHCFPPLRHLLICVDPFGRRQSIPRNIPAVKEAFGWVRRGGMLLVFPAGEVAHVNLRAREISDPPWGETCARIIQKTGAAALPVFFPGANGPLFHLLGLIHPRLRTARLPRELLNQQGRTIRLKVGKPIPFAKLQSFAHPADMIAYLRLRTYILKAACDSGARVIHPQPLPGPLPPLPLQAPPGLSRMVREVQELPREQLLTQSGEFLVYYARAAQIPCLLVEIGRLRELTFRRAHEGTGKPLDLDRFDRYYLHLFIWNSATHEVVGAYRIGRTDHILRYLGREGLYTSTLFHYKRALLEQISPALELGRSFVRPEYQKSYSSLLLLWKGISAFVVRHPRYKILFGPVSINNEYHTISQQLMAATLKFNNNLPGLDRLVTAKNPFPIKPINGCDLGRTKVIQDINELSDLIMDIDTANQGIPILLKQYLKMGGKVLGFNRDPSFGNVLDTLILVDLTLTPVNLLERYMGKPGAETFLRHHDTCLASAPAGNMS